MNTSARRDDATVKAIGVSFTGDVFHVHLEDGRTISVPMRQIPWLGWLANAAPQQRANWRIEPGGFAIYWPDLDDGVEVCHLLAATSLLAGSSRGSTAASTSREALAQPEH